MTHISTLVGNKTLVRIIQCYLPVWVAIFTFTVDAWPRPHCHNNTFYIYELRNVHYYMATIIVSCRYPSSQRSSAQPIKYASLQTPLVCLWLLHPLQFMWQLWAKQNASSYLLLSQNQVRAIILFVYHSQTHFFILVICACIFNHFKMFDLGFFSLSFFSRLWSGHSSVSSKWGWKMAGLSQQCPWGSCV